MTTHSAGAVLDFWFGPPDGPDFGGKRDVWFRGGPEFDDACRQFAAACDSARAGGLDSWAEDADGCLALIILLDQIPRNIHRGTPDAFAGDEKARGIVVKALSRGLDRGMLPVQRLFLYLPLEHSESLTDQERCVALFQALGDPDLLEYARQHRDIVARFGRFPHRNTILGRESTPEETAFLEQPGSSF